MRSMNIEQHCLEESSQSQSHSQAMVFHALKFSIRTIRIGCRLCAQINNAIQTFLECSFDACVPYGFNI